MTKSEFRALYKEKRKALSDAEIEVSGELILEQLKSFDWEKVRGVHIYLSISKYREVNTQPLIDYFLNLGKTIAVPKVIGKEMVNCRLEKDTVLKMGKFHTIEPEVCEPVAASELDVVLVPMLICDKTGHRIGYGGGYYDRFLGGEGKNLLKIGINFFEPIERIPGIEPTDIPLDYCVTPSEIVSFTSSGASKSVK